MTVTRGPGLKNSTDAGAAVAEGGSHKANPAGMPEVSENKQEEKENKEEDVGIKEAETAVKSEEENKKPEPEAKHSIRNTNHRS